MPNTGIDDSPGLLQRFEVAAYGCHEAARKLLRKELRDPKISIETFLFVEYFCLEPLVVSRQDVWASSRLFFPYIRRILEENQFLWFPNEAGALVFQPKSSALLEAFANHKDFVLPGPDATVGSQVFETWHREGVGTAGSKRAFPYRQRISRGDWDNTLQQIRLNASSKTRRTLLLEFGLVGSPWQQSNHLALLYQFPIASDAVFYGYCLLCVPAPAPGADDAGSKVETFDSSLVELFPKIVNDIYLPVLTLLHESLLEERLRARLEKRTDAETASRVPIGANASRSLVDAAAEFMRDDNIPFLHDLVTKDGRTGAYSEMERALHALWKRRLELLTRHIGPEDACERLKESLLFAKYQVASPGMVEAVRTIMGAARRLEPPRGQGDPLPVALVYGTPGSGKDTLARMIPLFAPEYFFDDVHTVNMSALKPDLLTGPLLQGLSIANAANVSTDAGRQGFSLDGILYAATRSQRQPGEDDRPGSTPRKATFILDELNSLDVDLQGILLRILEQGEVTPLLGLDRQHIRHLIIGIVNEDPEDISRELELRDLLLDKGKFGSLLSGLLYEVVRRSRRLRNDLYHRLKRDLYVRVPEIEDRREDIPILFYLNVTRVKMWKDARVELPAYRLLMDSRLTWPGNIRAIQSVAKRAVQEAEKRRIQHISFECVREALEAEFREIKGKLDDAH